MEQISRYEKYKDSGIEWIGEIPENWDVKKIKHRCYVKGRVGWKGLKSSEFLTNGFSYLVTGTDFKNDTVDWDNCYHIDEERYNEDLYIQLQNEDLLITKDGTIGKLAVVTNLDKPACLNSGIFVVRSTKEDFLTRYLLWVLKSSTFTDFNGLTAYGSTIQHLYQNVFIEFAFAFPPVDIQISIANYLQKKTTEIDRIIANKQKLITLYEEEKQAIINQAITKGLDPNVKLKDTGLEWLGEIPEHWIIKKLKHITEVKDGTHDTPDYVTESENSIPLITSKDITSNCIDFSDCKHIAYEDYLIINNRSNVAFNDIIMPMIGTVGGAVIVDTNRPFSIKNVALFKTSEINYNVKYIKFFIDSEVIKKQFEIESRGGVQNFVSLSLLRNLYAFDVPKVEQDAIVTYIENESNNINLLIEKFNKQIDLLQEYRTTLISEVVTGKIKVINTIEA